MVGRGEQEDNLAMLLKYPNCREYWDDKRARMDRIQVPAYILGSFSTMLHTIGSFRAFEEIAHQKKWQVDHHRGRGARLQPTNANSHPGSPSTPHKNGTIYTANPGPTTSKDSSTAT